MRTQWYVRAVLSLSCNFGIVYSDQMCWLVFYHAKTCFILWVWIRLLRKAKWDKEQICWTEHQKVLQDQQGLLWRLVSWVTLKIRPNNKYIRCLTLGPTVICEYKQFPWCRLDDRDCRIFSNYAAFSI